jgi:hypothetical protein
MAFGMAAQATWANMITCFDLPVSQAKDLIQGEGLATASTTEAPWQRTSLANIGLCAFVLGFREVEINTIDGIINARNEHASITSMPANIPGVPYLVALEGDLHSLAHDVRQAKPAVLLSVAYRAKGFIDFVHFYARPQFFQPMLILYGLQNGWSSDHWKSYYRSRLLNKLYSRRRNLYREATDAEMLLKDWEKEPTPSELEVPSAPSEGGPPPSESEEDEENRKEHEGIKFWQKWGVGGCPTICQVLAFMPYHCTCSGFPLESYLKFLHGIIHRGASNLWSNGGSELCKIDDELIRGLVNDEFKYIVPTSSFILTAGGFVRQSASGSRSWIFHDSFVHFPATGKNFPAWVLDTDGPLPVTKLIHELLSGSDVDALRDYLDFEIPTIIDPLDSVPFDKGTVEAELYFALLSVESRISRLWEHIIANGPDRDPFPSERAFGRALTCFLALWVEICQVTTPFSSPGKFTAAFEEVIGSWAGKNSKLCVPEPEYAYLTYGFPKANSVGNQDWFYQWVTWGDRKGHIEKMLPYLQLRGILLYHFLCCSGDSSNIAAAEMADVTLRFV